MRNIPLVPGLVNFMGYFRALARNFPTVVSGGNNDVHPENAQQRENSTALSPECGLTSYSGQRVKAASFCLKAYHC